MLGGLSRPEHARPLSDRARAGGVGGALNADHLAFGGGLVSSLATFVRGEQLGLNLGGDK